MGMSYSDLHLWGDWWYQWRGWGLLFGHSRGANSHGNSEVSAWEHVMTLISFLELWPGVFLEKREEVGQFYYYLKCCLVKSSNEVYWTVPMWCIEQVRMWCSKQFNCGVPTSSNIFYVMWRSRWETSRPSARWSSHRHSVFLGVLSCYKLLPPVYWWRWKDGWFTL